jgi:hypothetical protein
MLSWNPFWLNPCCHIMLSMKRMKETYPSAMTTVICTSTAMIVTNWQNHIIKMTQMKMMIWLKPCLDLLSRKISLFLLLAIMTSPEQRTYPRVPKSWWWSWFRCFRDGNVRITCSMWFIWSLSWFLWWSSNIIEMTCKKGIHYFQGKGMRFIS